MAAVALIVFTLLGIASSYALAEPSIFVNVRFSDTYPYQYAGKATLPSPNATKYRVDYHTGTKVETIFVDRDSLEEVSNIRAKWRSAQVPRPVGKGTINAKFRLGVTVDIRDADETKFTLGYTTEERTVVPDRIIDSFPKFTSGEISAADFRAPFDYSLPKDPTKQRFFLGFGEERVPVIVLGYAEASKSVSHEPMAIVTSPTYLRRGAVDVPIIRVYREQLATTTPDDYTNLQIDTVNDHEGTRAVFEDWPTHSLDWIRLSPVDKTAKVDFSTRVAEAAKKVPEAKSWRGGYTAVGLCRASYQWITGFLPRSARASRLPR